VQGARRRGRRLGELLGGRREPSVDPFVALRVQTSLARLDAEVRELGQDGARFARAHKLRAALAAYDDVLAEACSLAGLEAPSGPPDLRRLVAEAQLRAAGWEW